MKIIISPRAEKDLKRVNRVDQIALVKKIRSIVSSFSDLKNEKLIGYADMYRIRVEQYRIVFRLRKSKCYIILIGHRKDIYQLLRHLFD